jgi:hypothetical protein
MTTGCTTRDSTSIRADDCDDQFVLKNTDTVVGWTVIPIMHENTSKKGFNNGKEV